MQLSGDRHASGCLIVVFRVRFDRLTPAEKSYLATMASLGEGPIAPEIRPKCSEKECVQLALAGGPDRQRHGIQPRTRDTSFTVPLFDGKMNT